MVSKEFKGLIRGEYGKTPVPVDEGFARRIIGNDKMITCRPADLLEPELAALRKKCAADMQQDEDVLTYALFEQVAEKFFAWRREQQLGIDAEDADPAHGIHPV